MKDLEPIQIVEILRKSGVIVTIDEATDILAYLIMLADTTVDNFIENKERGTP